MCPPVIRVTIKCTIASVEMLNRRRASFLIFSLTGDEEDTILRAFGREGLPFPAFFLAADVAHKPWQPVIIHFFAVGVFQDG